MLVITGHEGIGGDCGGGDDGDYFFFQIHTFLQSAGLGTLNRLAVDVVK